MCYASRYVHAACHGNCSQSAVGERSWLQPDSLKITNYTIINCYIVSWPFFFLLARALLLNAVKTFDHSECGSTVRSRARHLSNRQRAWNNRNSSLGTTFRQCCFGQFFEFYSEKNGRSWVVGLWSTWRAKWHRISITTRRLVCFNCTVQECRSDGVFDGSNVANMVSVSQTIVTSTYRSSSQMADEEMIRQGIDDWNKLRSTRMTLM